MTVSEVALEPRWWPAQVGLSSLGREVSGRVFWGKEEGVPVSVGVVAAEEDVWLLSVGDAVEEAKGLVGCSIGSKVFDEGGVGTAGFEEVLACDEYELGGVVEGGKELRTLGEVAGGVDGYSDWVVLAYACGLWLG